MPNTDLMKLSISELAPRIKSREVSPLEVTEAALEQADQLQPKLNSFITILHKQALSQARELEAELMRGEYRGPLHGIPIGIKDNLETAGIRTTVGTKPNLSKRRPGLVALDQIRNSADDLRDRAAVASVCARTPHSLCPGRPRALRTASTVNLSARNL